MSLITCKELSVIRSSTLFTGLDLSVARGDCLGLVAANGRGKTSLLRILAGEDEASAGIVTRARGLVAAYVPQDPPARLLPESLYDSVLDALPAETAETESWRVDIVLEDLAVPEDLRGRAVGRLSGGWQRTMLLARAAVIEPQIMLLDEPTNHLDLARIGILERFLSSTLRSCAVIVASHDRAFLDTVTTRTLFLRQERSAEFSMPYSRALEALEQRDAAADRNHRNQLRKAKALRDQAAKLKNIGINSGSDLLTVKTKQLSERADRLEQAAQPAHKDRPAGSIRLANSGTHARALVSIRKAAIAAPGAQILFRTGDLWIENGDRVVLLGPNGAGKTRMIDRIRLALSGQEDAEIRGAASLRLGYSDQALSQLERFPTPWEAVKQFSHVNDHQARAVLAEAGVAIEAQSASIGRLSGGQRARLALLLLRLAQPNFYLLDEPTNHLDIEGQETLARELIDNRAACLLVSHDRAFVQSIATRYWVISGKQLIEVEDPVPVFEALMAG